MDEKTCESSKVDAVLHSVTFYPLSCTTGSLSKGVSGVHMKTYPCTANSHKSRNISVNCRPAQKTVDQSERCDRGRKSTLVEKWPKSVESARLTKSKYRLIRKPKYTLLPYKRGQLKFRTDSVHSTTSVLLNSVLSSEKENKMYSDDCSVTASAEKLNTRDDTSRRFFKASFGKRRQFTLNMRGLTTSHVKLNQLKQHERNTTLTNKQLHINAARDCCKAENDVESATECCKNDLCTMSNVDTTFESSGCDSVHKYTELPVESSAENGSASHIASNSESLVSDSSFDVEECCPVASTSDKWDHTMSSVVMSTKDSQSYSDNTATSHSLKHGTFYLHIFDFTMHQFRINFIVTYCYYLSSCTVIN